MVREEDLPIDIYYNKLLDWLIDRRHCNIKWQDHASSVREKINTAIQDMPPNEEIANLLAGTYINFFHCQKIVELLKECGEGSTNFFGQYSSQRMKDWQVIVQLYREDSVFLAEASHMLMVNVNFEIPALKRQISKCQQIQQESTRKENDCTTNSAVFREKYRQVCKEMGILGDNVRRELIQLVDTLPEKFDVIAQKVKGLNVVVEYYHAFVNFVAQKNISAEDVCSLISFMIVNGNATVYQWKTGKVPTKIEEKVQTIDLEAMAEITGITDNGDEVEIDWGDGGADEIDFRDDGGIDWGDSGISLSVEDNVKIEVEDSGQENPDGENGGIAAGDEAQTILELTRTRNAFIDELLELQAFLQQRLFELKSEPDIITVNQFQSASDIIQSHTKESLGEMLAKVSDIMNDLSSRQMKNLYLIKSSQRYVDRIADSLLQKLQISEKLLNQVSVLKKKSKEAAETQIETLPKLEILVKKTKTLQGQIEKEISSRYKNRKVNVMGEINTI